MGDGKRPRLPRVLARALWVVEGVLVGFAAWGVAQGERWEVAVGAAYLAHQASWWLRGRVEGRMLATQAELIKAQRSRIDATDRLAGALLEANVVEHRRDTVGGVEYVQYGPPLKGSEG